MNSTAQPCKQGLNSYQLHRSLSQFERHTAYLFARLELFAVEAVEEEGEEEVEHHEVPHDEGGQEYGQARLGDALNKVK